MELGLFMHRKRRNLQPALNGTDDVSGMVIDFIKQCRFVFRPVDTAGIGADYEKRQRSQYTQQ